jgi:hypothetical protein
VSVVGEMVGDNAIHLLIDDTGIPEVVVTSPDDGAISNEVDLPVEGFLFETGSGVATFMAYLDGSTDGIALVPMEIWSTVLMDLEQGYHELLIEAWDKAGNYGNTTVTFSIDAQPPSLEISEPEDGDVTRESTILIQGTFGDDVSSLSEIVVRINGVVYESTSGTISEYIDLTEGVNAIEVDATDKAGNRMSVRLSVTRDTYAPTLYVYTPRDQLVTATKDLEVSGLSEANTPIIIEQVLASTGSVIGSTTITARIDGTFSHMLVLQEGEQHIVVTAQDTAGNVRTITRSVTMDTTPPRLQIVKPDKLENFVNTASIELVGQVDDPNPELIRVFINGLEIEHNIVFSKVLPLTEVWVEDPVGNTARTTINVTRDTTKPSLSVETPTHILTKDATLVVRGQVDADADTVSVAGVEVNVDEQFRFSREVPLAQETSPIMVVATDRAGNTNSYAIHFVFDNTAPTLSLNPPPPAETRRLILYLNGSISDDTATITTVNVRGVEYPVVNGKFSVLVDLSTAEGGWNNFTVKATDDAGNTATQKVSIQYVPPPQKEDEGDEGISSETLTFWFLLLLVAAVVLIATVFVFTKREVRA